MSRSLILLSLWIPLTTFAAPKPRGEGFYSLSAHTIDGRSIKLEKYQGKLTLVVNVASKCGFTPQYKGLEHLYRKYRKRGFLVLGFPSNDFGGQEPGSNAQIKAFCDTRYGVTFPLFAKAPVTGKNKQRVYKFLTEEVHPRFQGEIEWNFEKFLVDRSGAVVQRFKSSVTPESKELRDWIEKFLPRPK